MQKPIAGNAHTATFAEPNNAIKSKLMESSPDICRVLIWGYPMPILNGHYQILPMRKNVAGIRKDIPGRLAFGSMICI